MIFEQMLSAEQDYQRRIGKYHSGSESMRSMVHMWSNPDAVYAEQRQGMLNNACLPIEAAAKECGFDADDYRAKANRNQALLFVMHNSEEFVPLWSVDLQGQVIPAALEVAKAYIALERHNNAGEPLSPRAFCENIALKMVYMDSSMLIDETGPHVALTQAFVKLPYEKYLGMPEINIAGRSIRKTLSLTVDGYNNDYASEMLKHTVDVVYRVGHKPDSAEAIVDILRKKARDHSLQARGLTLA